MSDNVEAVGKQSGVNKKREMERKETSTNDSGFDSDLQLEKRIQFLENELMRANAKVASLAEFFLLVENVVSRCSCPELQEQISSLLSTLRCLIENAVPVDCASHLRHVDAATQCDGDGDGEYALFVW